MFKIIRGLKMARAFIRIMNDPNRLNEVFNLSDGVAQAEILDSMAIHFGRVPRGAAALREKPRLTVDLDALGTLPPGTLGRVFSDHMRANNLDTKSIPTLPSNDEREYILAHLYETHDVWHVVTGFHTDVAGELGLQAFYASQFPGPLPPIILAAGLLNTALFRRDEIDLRFHSIVSGWMLGRRSQAFFGVRWADHWARPITEVRASLGVDLVQVQASVPALAIA